MADVDPANAPMPERKRDRVMRAMRVPLAVRTSDLPLRLASAAVMLGVAALAFWAGTWAVRALISAVGIYHKTSYSRTLTFMSNLPPFYPCASTSANLTLSLLVL